MNNLNKQNSIVNPFTLTNPAEPLTSAYKILLLRLVNRSRRDSEDQSRDPLLTHSLESLENWD